MENFNMGIMEKLSDMRRKVDEDWRDDARTAKAAKGVHDFHRERLEKLNFKIDTSFGDFRVNIKPDWNGGLDLRVYLEDDYLFYDHFKNSEDLKEFIEDRLTDKIYEKVRDKFKYKIEKMPRDEAKATLRKFDGLLDELDKEIDLKIDFDDLERKLHRYSVYSSALNARSSNKTNLEYKARRSFEKEHGFEVGDVVYGSHRSDLRDGKAYVVAEIMKNDGDKEHWKYRVEPENGRGQGATVYGYQLYLDSDVINAAVSNPDDPKYDKKFDQQQYMMDRYSADNQFDEAVELLNSCGLIVESVESEEVERLLAKYDKYKDLDDLVAAVQRDTREKPEITFGRRNKIVWVESEKFVLVGFYQFDEETGKYRVELQSVKLK
jgi:hypothetical protein